jgi:hypothetical protein
MGGKRINGVEYIHLLNCNELRKNSLYDNIHITLKEIFWNADSADVALQAINFNNMYVNVINIEDIPEYNLKKILRFLNRIADKRWFEFVDLEEGENINEEEYIKFDIWWQQFKELRITLNKHCETLN